jgi:CubicO group peptidase (beta-lactamase class C family)
LLGEALERMTGMPLDPFCRQQIFFPLELETMTFNPAAELRKQIPPTEEDKTFRHRVIQGEVNDENAWVMGGVAGHAGLFSTASDLAVFMQMILNHGRYGGQQFLKPETVNLFTTRTEGKGNRALGWDAKTVNGYSSAGSLFSERSFGHTGFTGTSIWADPEKKIFVILLTNRVNPTRNNSKIMQIRPAVSDAVMRAIAK